MKKFLLAAFFLTAATNVTAQAPQQTIQQTVGIVQLVKVAKESKAGKAIASQAKKMDGDFRSMLKTEEQKLKDAESQLVRQRTVLAPEAYGKKREEFQKQVATMQKKVRDRRSSMQKGLQAANAELQQNIGTIIKDIAVGRKLMLVVPQEQVLFFENSLNITDEVLSKLNAKLPNVKVSAK